MEIRDVRESTIDNPGPGTTQYGDVWVPLETHFKIPLEGNPTRFCIAIKCQTYPQMLFLGWMDAVLVVEGFWDLFWTEYMLSNLILACVWTLYFNGKGSNPVPIHNLYKYHTNLEWKVSSKPKWVLSWTKTAVPVKIDRHSEECASCLPLLPVSVLWTSLLNQWNR